MFSVLNDRRAYIRQRLRRHGYGVSLLVLALGVLWTAQAMAQEGSASPTHTINFQGNQMMDAAVLRKAASEELEAFERSGHRPADADDAAFQMLLAYRQKGYAFATVDFDIETDPDRLIFRIAEGPQVMIDAIDLIGAEALDRDQLLQFFEGKQKGLLRTAKLVFVRSAIQAAVSQVRDAYTMQGYMDVTVGQPEYHFTADRTRVTVTVEIKEGTQYLVEELQVSGDALPEVRAALVDIARELEGKPYYRRRELVFQSRLQELYGNLGYPQAAVDIASIQGSKPEAIVLVAEVIPGPLVTIGNIEVRGNTRTRAQFIRSRLAFASGDRFSLDRRKASFSRLYQTGLFTRVELRLDPQPSSNIWPMIVEVEEGLSKEVYIEPGWGSYEQLRLKAGLRESNLMGTGREVGLEGLASLKAQTMAITLTDPWFLNTEIQADVPIFYSRREEPSFIRRDVGASVQFTRALAENLTGSAIYTYRVSDLSSVEVELLEEDLKEDYDFSSVKLQVTYDTRNDVFFPTSGLKSFLAVEHADRALGGEITFTRMTAGLRVFFPLIPRTTLGLRFSSGLIVPGGDEVSVPLGERFFNGGGSKVRSFSESRLGPKDASGDPVGGLGFNIFSLEVRRQLIGNLIGTVFFDYGNVSPNRTREELGQPPYDSRDAVVDDTLTQFFSDFRPAVGVGLQYLLPIGPARLDVAFNPDRDTSRGEDTVEVHFSIGMAF